MKDLKLSLIIQALDRATAPLHKVGAALSGLRQHTEKLQHAMHKLGVAEFVGAAFFTGVAAEAGHAIFELTDRVAEMGEAALLASEKTGASVEQMQRWSWVAKQMHVEADSVARAFSMMEFHVSQAMDGKKESLRALTAAGISVPEIKLLANDPDAMFARIMRGFAGIKTATEQARVGRGLFGRGFLDLAPLLKAPPEKIAALVSQLRKAHAVMSKEDAEAAQKFIQAKQNMGLAIQGLELRIGEKLIPKFTEAIDKVTAWIESLKDESVRQFTDSIGKLADKFTALLPKIESVIPKVIDLIGKFTDLASNTKVLTGVFWSLVAVMAINAVVAFASSAAAIVRVGAAAVAAVPLIASLIPEIAGLSSAFVALDLAMDANPIGVLCLAILAAVAAIALLVAGFVFLVRHWDDVVRAFEDGAKAIETAFEKLDKALPPWLRALINGGINLERLTVPGFDSVVRLVDGLAHAPRPPAKPPSAVVKPGSQAPGHPFAPPAAFNWPSGSPFAPPTAFNRPASAPVQPGGVLGTIVVKAEAGTKVTQTVTSSPLIKMDANRGVFYA
jgi:hypothetical protein